MLPGHAGGRVANGAEREAELNPWRTLGNLENAGEENADLAYELEVMNCSSCSQSVTLATHPYSKHVMNAPITPERQLPDNREHHASRTHKGRPL